MLVHRVILLRKDSRENLLYIHWVITHILLSGHLNNSFCISNNFRYIYIYIYSVQQKENDPEKHPVLTATHMHPERIGSKKK